MKEELKEIFAEIFELDKESINETLSKDTIDNWDSLRHLTLVAAIEQKFEISLEPDEIQQLDSFQNALDLLNNKFSV